MLEIDIEEYFTEIRSGNNRFLAKAITLMESKKPEHREMADQLLEKLIPFTGNSTRIAVSGIPGAGKSTFIESFGKFLISQGKKVAVLAVDPSSKQNKGSILGDKTRMEELVKSENAFIRPTPSSGFLGGIANTTYETMLICEAAGFDYILIETVGVGQSEVLAAEITDVFLLLKIIGDGDELQGIKRGIMEMADVIFINKVEEDNLTKAKSAKVELKRALQFLPKNADWKVPVILGSALREKGMDEVFASLNQFIEAQKKSNLFSEKRKKQAEKRFQYWVNEYVLQKTQSNESENEILQKFLENVTNLQSNPSLKARDFVDELWKRLH